MDARMAEKVNALAKSLRDSHLAANMEEAFEKATQILMRDYKTGNEPAEQKQGADELSDDIKTINELFDEEKKDSEKAEHMKEEVEEVKEEFEEEEKEDAEEREEVEEIDADVQKEEEDVEEMKEEE